MTSTALSGSAESVARLCEKILNETRAELLKTPNLPMEVLQSCMRSVQTLPVSTFRDNWLQMMTATACEALPAGGEAIDPSLATTSLLAEAPGLRRESEDATDLQVVVANKLKPEQVPDLIVFSDMQFDSAPELQKYKLLQSL